VKFKSFKTFPSFKPSGRLVLTVFLNRPPPPTMKRLNGLNGGDL
jgi:hypothetical protein